MKETEVATTWTNEVVQLVLRGERQIIGLDREPYGVAEQGMTGGPVLRGPWGSMGGMQRDYERYDAECKRLIAAHIHGHLRGARAACEREPSGCVGWLQGYCQRCGGTTRPEILDQAHGLGFGVKESP